MIYDVIIIGGGPAGLAAADEANKIGLKYHWFEQGKFLQNIKEVYPDDKMVLLKGWDPSFDIDIEVRFPMVDMAKKDFLASWRSYIAESSLRLTENSRIDWISQTEQGFKVCANDVCWPARHVIMAAGRIARPNKLGVRGENLPHVHYSLRRSDKYAGQDILVVGGGDTAVEVALMLAQENNVTIAYRRAEFRQRILHPNNFQLINEALANNELRAIFSAKVDEIFEQKVCLTIPDNELDEEWEQIVELKADHIFICIGSQKPALEILQGMTLVLNKKGLPEIMNGCCTTSVPNIHVIGDLRTDSVYKRGSISKSVWEGQMVIKEIF